MAGKAHWENIYATKSVQEVSWYCGRLDTSLELIQRAGLPRNAAIIDIGGGACTLVDDLLRTGFADVTVLDLSAAALQTAQQRLGALSERVQWMPGDVTSAHLAPEHYHLWHDRAVFHFLVTPQERTAYVAAATGAVKKSGFLILATFALDGPAKCSGLPVERYAPQDLARQFPAFALMESRREQHRTPAGNIQNFTWVLMQKRSDAHCSHPRL